MWISSIGSCNAASGDAIASQTVINPLANAMGRQTDASRGARRRTRCQPRMYTPHANAHASAMTGANVVSVAKVDAIIDAADAGRVRWHDASLASAV
jgi:hypothetical protein